jgi:hypothetical protein
MHVRSRTTVVSLISANWRGYSWRQLELSPDIQSLPTQNIYIEKLAGRDWKKEEKCLWFDVSGINFPSK